MPDTVSFQSGIVAVGGTLYVTAFNNTYAFDGATCRQKWMESRAEPATFLKVNRGVGYGGGRLFRGTGDAHVLALDAATGKLEWDVAIGDAKKGESVPMAPVAWNGMVFVGNAGGDNFGVTGRIYALDAATGRVVWQFRTLPDTGAARATWTRASAANPPTGGAMWTSFAIDTAHGALFVSTGNPAPDFVAELHPGRSLYSNSVLALDAKTGALLAYVQPVQGDFHDWDVSAAPALITTNAGKPFVLAAAKDGHVYGLELGTATDAAGKPTGAALIPRYKALTTTRENATTPLSSEHFTRFCPGSQGGVEWNGPTYQRETGLFYVNAIDWCTSVKLQRLDTLKGTPGQAWSGMDDPQMAFGRMDSTRFWKGWVTAVDAVSGEVKWHVQTPKPMVAGITATRGGIVLTGDLDGNVLAYDGATGRELWRDATGKAIGGGVISYAAAGHQHVAAAAGLNSAIWPVKGGAARVVVYALP
jgi:alcohol dehydrogenase (cytochrome c)